MNEDNAIKALVADDDALLMDITKEHLEKEMNHGYIMRSGSDI